MPGATGIAQRVSIGEAERTEAKAFLNLSIRHVFFLVSPDLVHFGCLLKRDAMGNNVAWIDLSLLDSLK
jgi:hypothetical protein